VVSAAPGVLADGRAGLVRRKNPSDVQECHQLRPLVEIRTPWKSNNCRPVLGFAAMLPPGSKTWPTGPQTIAWRKTRSPRKHLLPIPFCQTNPQSLARASRWCRPILDNEIKHAGYQRDGSRSNASSLCFCRRRRSLGRPERPWTVTTRHPRHPSGCTPGRQSSSGFRSASSVEWAWCGWALHLRSSLLLVGRRPRLSPWRSWWVFVVCISSGTHGQTQKSFDTHLSI